MPEEVEELSLFTDGWGAVGLVLCRECVIARGLEWEDGEAV